MIVEQSNDQLTIQKEEFTSLTVNWLILLIGIGASIFSYWINVIWLTFLFAFGVFISVLISGSRILEPRFFIFNRITGDFTVLYQIRVLIWKLEWKKVYLLQEIKDVILITYIEGKNPVSYHTGLLIQSTPNDYSLKQKMIWIPGKWKDYVSTQSEAVSIASFLGLQYKPETRAVQRSVFD